MLLTDWSWQILAIIAILFTISSQAFNKYQIHRGSGLQVTFYKYLSAVLFVSLIWKVGSNTWPSLWWIIILYGMVSGLVITVYTKASKHSLSKTILASPASQLVSIALAAILFKEWQLFDYRLISGKQMILALLLMPVVIYLFYEKTKESKQWTWLMSIFIFWWGTGRVFQKYFLASVDAMQLTMLQYWGCLLAIFIATRIRKVNLQVTKKFAITGLIHGIVASLGVLIFYFALQKTEVTRISLFRQPIFTLIATIIGLWGFKEIKIMSVKKWLGMIVALIMTGLVLMASK